MSAIGTTTRAGVNLYTFDGTVVDAKTWSETIVSGGGGGGNVNTGSGTISPISISSKTVTHNQFFVRNARGDERSFEFVNWGVATRPGNFVTVIWAVPEGRKTGPYVAIYNHTTKDLSYSPAGTGWGLASFIGIFSIAFGAFVFLLLAAAGATGIGLLIGSAWVGLIVWLSFRSRKLRSALDLSGKVAEIKAMPLESLRATAADRR